MKLKKPIVPAMLSTRNTGYALAGVSSLAHESYTHPNQQDYIETPLQNDQILEVSNY